MSGRSGEERRTASSIRTSGSPGALSGRGRWPVILVSIPMLSLLIVPIFGLMLASSPTDLRAAVRDPLFLPALFLSARTSLTSLALVVLLGTPLAWWLGRSRSRVARFVEVLVELPIVVPPAVVGIALLYTLGRNGPLGGVLGGLGLQIPFTTAAVVIAQVVVSAPFFIQASASAFRAIDEDLLLVARTLGASPRGAFARVALPVAMPGIVVGAALAWARALGEFGATLLFAGNLPGSTQTMPLAIYMALESDVRVALALALVLATVALALLFLLRSAPTLWARFQRSLPGVADGRGVAR